MYLCTGFRVQVIEPEKGVPERFPFRGTLPRSANFGALEMENRPFCDILGGKKRAPRPKYFVIVWIREAFAPFPPQQYGPPNSHDDEDDDDEDLAIVPRSPTFLPAARMLVRHWATSLDDSSGGRGGRTQTRLVGDRDRDYDIDDCDDCDIDDDDDATTVVVVPHIPMHPSVARG